MPIKVMIIDDSAVVREALTAVLTDSPDFEVVATAADPYIAARKLTQIVPDVITLDIEMPRMDGLSFLRRLMSQHPLPVVICSSVAGAGSSNALAALSYGAVEIVEKPKFGTKTFIEESAVLIQDAVRAAHASKPNRLRSGSTTTASSSRNDTAQRSPDAKLTADAVIAAPTSAHVPETTERIVCVGASTGGTEALRELLEAMPLDAPGICIVQHMPERFTSAFADRLDSLCQIEVKEAQDNDSVLPGRALIAPGNKHMLLKRSGARYYVEIKDGPLVSRHRPSVDVLFRSAARYAGQNAVGVIMTGMGDDGAHGMSEMHAHGAFTLAQDEATSVVFGMPGAAVKRGAVDRVCALQALPQAILERAGRGVDTRSDR